MRSALGSSADRRGFVLRLADCHRHVHYFSVRHAAMLSSPAVIGRSRGIDQPVPLVSR